jgi:hypothetical protein
VHLFVREGVCKTQPHGHEQESVQVESVPIQPVVSAVTVKHVSHQGVAQVGEMTPDLMKSSCLGADPDQGVSG